MTETAMPVRGGMSARTARTVENAIIGLCIAALVFVFQPFSKLLSGIGMGLVVLGGLAFNLVPLCEPGRPARSLVKAAIIVVVVFVVVLILALGSAHLYGEWLGRSGPERSEAAPVKPLRCQRLEVDPVDTADIDRGHRLAVG